jgi:YidC/Oxa1 family membrane protein insertase
LNEFRNPNQNEDMSGRMLLAFALTFVVILITQQFVAKYYKKPEAPPAKNESIQQPAGNPTPTVAAPASAQQTTVASPSKTTKTAAAAKQASSESETVMENDLYRITFTNKGAQVKSWILKKYQDDHRKPLELVHPIAAPQYGYPLSFYTYDEGLRKKLNESMYVPIGSRESAGEIQSPESLRFEFSDGDTTVSKEFSFRPHSYEIDVETSVTQKGSSVAAYPAWPAGFGDETVAASYAAARIDYERADKVERVPYKKVNGGSTIAGPFYWAGTVDQYFAAVFLPDDPNSTTLVTLHNIIDIPKNLDKPDPNEHDRVSALGAAVGNPSGPTRQRLFVGPKALNVLASVHPSDRAGGGAAPNRNLEGLVDFGFFSFVAKPLFLWLRWTYQHVVLNYGWAILILTVVINTALLPLRISQMKSAMRMQKIQPQVQAINNKYKQFKLTDPRQADKNREIQELYKREGINPLGGCFPTLLQLPFLWAFYTMLGVAIELRHAPWLWIHDLSAADPYHLINILFVVSMFMMQRLTPQGGMDPAQQKMMMVMMPIMLGAFTWNLSSGLGIYWAASNLYGILQQVGFNRTSFGQEMRAMMQKRAQKKGNK